MYDQLYQVGLVAIAGALGAIVGVEREFADKPAGLRTHMFVCAASALLMLLGDGVVDQFQQEDRNSISADPIRIIQAIVVGISFLGAGTIIHHHDNRVEGLTTAASILLTAGIGISVAVDKYVLATGIALMALTILLLVGVIERQIQRYLQRRKNDEEEVPTRTNQARDSNTQEQQNHRDVAAI
ncbi:MAG: MgtC/SapB family protein [Pirellulaceae bacterium]|nr:MgtC/SapB family protein [Pirellulaceae bacterium]